MNNLSTFSLLIYREAFRAFALLPTTVPVDPEDCVHQCFKIALELNKRFDPRKNVKFSKPEKLQ